MPHQKGWPEGSLELRDLSTGDQYQVYTKDGKLLPRVWTKLRSSDKGPYWRVIHMETLELDYFQMCDWPVKKVGNYFEEK